MDDDHSNTSGADDRELREALAENERLRAENKRLKALLESFALRPASSLTPPPATIPHKAAAPAPDSVATQDSAQQSEIRRDDVSWSREDKVRLFRSLFRGREDVFAIRWESKKGRSGYSPACANEWDPFLCRKPCAKCANSKYVSISDEVIQDHILGKRTIGVYPMLQDETCWFLATDFDKEGWREDAGAFLRICQEIHVPAVLERSRSGKGGHVWIFFDEPLPASLARKLGTAILTRAMDRRHQLGLDSYDRFFPNQDTMPKGGFGSLIALPLP